MANKGERGHKDQGRKNRNKGEMYFPSSIWNLFYTPYFEGLSHVTSLWLGFWVWLKKNYHLKEIKVEIWFFSLKNQSTFKEELL